MSRTRRRLTELADAHGDLVVAYRPDGSAVSAAALAAIAAETAGSLGTDLGGRRVALIASNTVEALGALHGIWQAGCSAVLIGPLVPEREAERRRAITGVVACVDYSTGHCVTEAVDVDGFDITAPGEAAVVFTSGTTGLAKGASIGDAGLDAAATTVRVGAGFRDADRPLSAPPRSPQIVFVSLAHMGGLLATQTSWALGKPLLFIPKFDIDITFELVERFGVSALSLTPAMVYDLVHEPTRRTLGTVRSVSCGTAPLPETTRLAFEERYGIPVLRNYGQTEFSGAIAFERFDDVQAGRRPPMSVGRIADGVSVRIVDESGRDVETGHVGEIWVSGGSAMAGYLDDQGDAALPGTGGWIATGDLGTLDENGFLSVVGRVRDVLICGGFNIYPAVVEAAVNELEHVLDSAVVGRADDRLGDIPVAAVVVDDGVVVDVEAMRTQLRDHLSRYEIPREIRVVESIPRTANGKVDRTALEALFSHTHQLGVGSGDITEGIDHEQH
jgi:fatty-acyl-CoA synthase/O-succinylbenzoic acid--CoA ligase